MEEEESTRLKKRAETETNSAPFTVDLVSGISDCVDPLLFL
jgi:hypothetical protein